MTVEALTAERGANRDVYPRTHALSHIYILSPGTSDGDQSRGLLLHSDYLLINFGDAGAKNASVLATGCGVDAVDRHEGRQGVRNTAAQKPRVRCCVSRHGVEYVHE